MKKIIIVFMSTIFLGGCSYSVSKTAFHNWKELKENAVVMQGYDYSCGAAALATVIRYYYNKPVTELDILKTLTNVLPIDEGESRKKNGLSMQDITRVAEIYGYKIVGVQLKYDSLLKLDRPMIVYLESKGYKHFAVYKGCFQNRIYLADPLRGNIRMTVDAFFKVWKGRRALILSKSDDLTNMHNFYNPVVRPFRLELFSIKNKL